MIRRWVSGPITMPSHAYAFITAILATAMLAEGADRSPLASECVPAGGTVRITAQQLTATPPSYAFLLSNLTDLPLSGIVIGRQDATTMTIFGVAPNIPSRMDTPSGWIGRRVHVEETWYLYYLWEAREAIHRLQPQQSLTGFRITLPSIEGRDLGELGGEEVKQVDFDRVPFEAALADGSCRAGTIGLDRLPR
jgi:hypothetical protein